MPKRRVSTGGPRTAAQKAGQLKAAQASAAKRRGTGKAKPTGKVKGGSSGANSYNRAYPSRWHLNWGKEPAYQPGLGSSKAAQKQRLAVSAANRRPPAAHATKGVAKHPGSAPAPFNGGPVSTYVKARSGSSPLKQAASSQAGNGRYGAPIKYKGKKSSHYDIETRRAKR